MKIISHIITIIALITLSLNSFASMNLYEKKAENIQCAIKVASTILPIAATTVGISSNSQLNGVFDMVKFKCVSQQKAELSDYEIKQVVYGVAISFLGLDNAVVKSFGETL
ncbi:MAG: hypothetical protein MK008_12170 [Bdellovibrionales bacterium]|nr:hypothetical protein [Bdellovibrionales bacterium]